jgi:hypothetical protein
MPYLGNTPTTQSFISGTDYFNGTGSQTAFTLSRTVASINDIQVTVNNVVQQPNDAYTLSGTTLTMTSAPSAGTNNVYVRYLSTTTQAITPSQGTVSWSTLNSDVQQDLGISFKNRIINGNMVIDQRNAGASVTVNSTAQTFSVDRWYGVGQATDGVYTLQQDAGAVTPPAGFTDYLGATVTTADASIGSTQVYRIAQAIEGFNIADLGWGTANAKTVTLSFWVRSSLTGTFGGSFGNSNFSRAYPFSYTISAANTWEQKSVTIAGDTTGTWLTTNGAGINVSFVLGMGSSFVGTPNAWNAGTFFAPTGGTNIISTNGATFYLTGVQLEVGTQATTFTTAGGSYGAELALCQRYYWQCTDTVGVVVNPNNTSRTPVSMPVPMRAAPTLVSGASFTVSGGSAGTPLIAIGIGYPATVTAVWIYNSSNNWSLSQAVQLNGGFTAEL